MNKIESPVKNSRYSSKVTKYTLYIIIILSVGLITRFYFFPYDVPLTADALYYFWYSSDIIQLGGLPDNWTPGNNGWPIVVGIVFSLFDSQNIFSLMQIQRIFSVIFLISMTIPVYYLCKKFVSRKFALIGASLIAFDPRLIINSFLGVTDPLFLLLSSCSLVAFLYSNKKTIYISFVLIGLATLVRTEGLAMFLVLSIMFFVKFRNEKCRTIPKFLLIVFIFGLILLPASLYRMDVTGSDYIFQRGLTHADKISSNFSDSSKSKNNFLEGGELFSKYFVWVLIPNFIIFIPLGIFLIFKKLNTEKITIILSLVILSLPALYGYSLSALDTRYLYVLFPMFAVLAVLSIEKISLKIPSKKIFVILIISAILVSSIVMYQYLKVDYEHEEESFEIMKDVTNFAQGINEFSIEARYIPTIHTINQWPTLYKNIDFKTSVIKYEENDSLIEFIQNSKEDGLTHIITDKNEKRPAFIQELFIEEEKYDFLEKIYDSKDKGFEYHVKVFKINFELLSLELEKKN